MVKDINSGSGASIAFYFIPMIVNNKLVWIGTNGADGVEMMVSDGTSGGTGILKNMHPSGDGLSAMSFPHLFNNKILFSCTDGTTGYELCSTDGSSVNSVVVKDIRSGSAASTPEFIATVGSYVAFKAHDGTGVGLCKYAHGTLYILGKFIDFSNLTVFTKVLQFYCLLFFLLYRENGWYQRWNYPRETSGDRCL